MYDITLDPHWTSGLDGKWMDDSPGGTIFWSDVAIHSARPSLCIMGTLQPERLGFCV